MDKSLFCLQMAMTVMMLILIIFVLPSKTLNYIFLSPLYQWKTVKSYQDFLAKDLKYKFVGIKITQKVGIKIQQMSMEVFLNEVL